MSMVVGYRLAAVDTGAEVARWGGSWGSCPNVPNPLDLPTGEQVCGAKAGETFNGFRLEPIVMEKPAPSQNDVIAERERRLALGFTYSFALPRGAHVIGTSFADMIGWDEVTKATQAAIALGMPTMPLTIVTNTGAAAITALEWQQILLAATAFRQPIWQASFALMAMSPIPDDYAADSYWL